ncbi:MAG: mechanosensitive ion channel domain-containing protein [Myxococcota bacterium]
MSRRFWFGGLLALIIAGVLSAGVGQAQEAGVAEGGLDAGVDADGEAPVDAGVADGEPDGEAEAVIAPPPPARPTEPPAPPEPAQAPPPAPTPVDVDVASPTIVNNPPGIQVVTVPAIQDGGESFLDSLLPGLPAVVSGSWLGTAALILLLMVLVYAVRRTRDRLPEHGVLPMVVRTAHIGLRLLVFLGMVALGVRVVAPALGNALPFAIVAGVIAIGWSARDVLPDAVAGVAVLFERRIRPGMWISGEGFEGVVEARGLRAIALRHPSGDRVAVPNRRLLTSVVRLQDGGATHDVALRFDGSIPAVRIRPALRDAVLTSPWVKSKMEMSIARDGADPTLWHVRAHLLDEKHATRFAGELLERAEDILAFHGDESAK